MKIDFNTSSRILTNPPLKAEEPASFCQKYHCSDSLIAGSSSSSSFDPYTLEKPHLPPTGLAEQITHQEVSKREIANLFFFIHCLRLQEENERNSEKISFELINRYYESTRKLMNDYFEVTDEIIAREKSEAKLSWIDRVFTAGFAISSLASVATLIFTEGASILSILAYFEVFLSFSSGGVQMAKSYLDYLNQKAKGLISEIELQRYLNTDKIRSSMKEMEESMRKVHAALDLLEEIIKSRQAIKIFR